jgi:alkaline phosphatase
MKNEKMKNARSIVCLIIVISLFSGILLETGCTAGYKAKNVILLIGDGMGPSQVLISRYAKEGRDGRLAMEQLEHMGLIASYYDGWVWDTEDIDRDGLREEVVWGAEDFNRDGIPDYENLIPDSASSGTSISTGEETYKGAICFDREGNPIKNIGDYAKKAGKSVGIVTTSRVTHATPAVFIAHNRYRDNEWEIAEEYLHKTQPDILLGGGREYFDGTGGRALLNDAKQEGYTVVYSSSQLSGINLDKAFKNDKKILGLFTPSHMNYEVDRSDSEPSISEMTKIALDYLEENKKGFFLMVEGARIDHAGHDNDAYRVINEVIAFDNAVKAVLEWAERRDDTLIIVTADHECGGINLIKEGETNDPKGTVRFRTKDGYAMDVSFGSTSHTGSFIPVYSQGPNSEKLEGTAELTYIFDVMHDALFPRS